MLPFGDGRWCDRGQLSPSQASYVKRASYLSLWVVCVRWANPGYPGHMTPPSHDPRPPYQQAADVLRDEIRAGRIKAGEQLPSHRELQERFGIANMTARSALRVLRDEGLIYTVQGRGSYVADLIEGDGGADVIVGDKRFQLKHYTRPQSAASTEAEPGKDDVQAAESLTETLEAVRDQLRNLNAEVQGLKREVAELKAQRRESPSP